MTRQHFIKTFAILSFPLCIHAYGAPPTLAAPFGDNMILQRDMNVPVWGSAGPVRRFKSPSPAKPKAPRPTPKANGCSNSRPCPPARKTVC